MNSGGVGPPVKLKPIDLSSPIDDGNDDFKSSEHGGMVLFLQASPKSRIHRGSRSGQVQAVSLRWKGLLAHRAPSDSVVWKSAQKLPVPSQRCSARDVSARAHHYGSVPRCRFPPEAWTANRNAVGGGGGTAGNAGMRQRFPVARFDDVTELDSGGRRRLLMQLEPEA